MQSVFPVVAFLSCFATCASALSISEHGVAHVFENGTAEMDKDRHREASDVCSGTICAMMPLCVVAGLRCGVRTVREDVRRKIVAPACEHRSRRVLVVFFLIFDLICQI